MKPDGVVLNKPIKSSKNSDATKTKVPVKS